MGPPLANSIKPPSVFLSIGIGGTVTPDVWMQVWQLGDDCCDPASSGFLLFDQDQCSAGHLIHILTCRDLRGKRVFTMRRILILATAILTIEFPVFAQQGPDVSSQNSQKGSAFPSPGADRGPAFPKSVSPTESNPTNWAKPPAQADPSYGWDPRANYWYNRTRRWR
jgi:hypothetical protein